MILCKFYICICKRIYFRKIFKCTQYKHIFRKLLYFHFNTWKNIVVMTQVDKIKISIYNALCVCGAINMIIYYNIIAL